MNRRKQPAKWQERTQARHPRAREDLLTCWLLQLMGDYNVMWVIEVLSQDGDF